MSRRILFLCTGNSARSQMAEAFLRHLGGDKYEAHSAGLRAQGLNPLTVQVMDEAGIDIRTQYSKSVKEYMGQMRFDDAIIVCRKTEADCPTIAADARQVHRWLFDDPAKVAGTDAEKIQKFREVRDQIEARVRLWLAETEEAEQVV